MELGIHCSRGADGGERPTVYIDSDFASDQDNGNSTTGVVLYFAGGPVDWQSAMQTVVATPSVGVE